MTGNADEQQSALQANFTHDAAFDHPLCVVYPSANSRDTWLSGIYTWYKVMSPGPEHKIYFHNVCPSYIPSLFHSGCVAESVSRVGRRQARDGARYECALLL